MFFVYSCTLEVLEGAIRVNAVQLFRKVDKNFRCRISWQSVIRRKDFAHVAWRLPAVCRRGPSKSSGFAGLQAHSWSPRPAAVLSESCATATGRGQENMGETPSCISCL